MVVKIVVLGSIKHGPYEVLVPHPFNPELFFGTPEQHEEAYQIACQVFEPAIEDTDVIIVWAPDGVKPGSHTAQDIMYAQKSGKKVWVIQEMEKLA